VRAFLQTHNGDVWIAADEGVSRVTGDRIERYGMRDGLAYFSTRCLLQTANDDVWIGTEQG
jgi:ligand-binding sensor domain-containing protein